MTSGAPTWVLGAGGLLGRSVVERCLAVGLPTVTIAVPWHDAVARRAALRRGAERLLARANGGPWYAAWCAGAGVVGTSDDDLASETGALTDLLQALRDVTGTAAADGVLFLASSAGGVYAGSARPPFTEASPPIPISAYGETKLVAERLGKDFAASTGACVFVGRISNLYGPGQHLDKPQGLISAVCRATLLHEPVTIYVPLDTVRDYLFVSDCADMVVSGLVDLGCRRRPAETVTKILATQRGTTVAAVLGEFRRVFKRPPLLVLAASPTAHLQVADLRLRSVCWPELDRLATTTLPAGIAATVRDIATRLPAATPASA